MFCERFPDFEKQGIYVEMPEYQVNFDAAIAKYEEKTPLKNLATLNWMQWYNSRLNLSPLVGSSSQCPAKANA